MKISYNWLKWYIDGELPSPEKLEEIFTFKLCEVECMEKITLPPLSPLDSSPQAGEQDWIFDLNILPNRAHDLLSHQGIARELAGILNMKFKDPTDLYKIPESHPTKLEIKLESSVCRRYMGRIVRNVKVGPSPEWVIKHLESIGQRSINNIVDATNLVMYDCGQPCHAFDAKKLSSPLVMVRNAEMGEKITTLSGQEIELQETDAVIAAPTPESYGQLPSGRGANEILAIAGVKGGTQAEVDSETTDIILEVANFEPVSVRKTARRLGILTDSAKRFENDLSPELASFAMKELSGLIVEMCPDAIFEEVIDVYPNKQESRTVEFSISWINNLLGTNLSDNEMMKILTDYGYNISGEGDTRTLAVPTLRLDLTGQHDIAEEVLRLYGLENIKAVPVQIPGKPKINETMYKMLAARKQLIAGGYREVMTYSFRKKGEFEIMRGVGDKGALRKNLADGLKESYEMNRLNAPLLGIDEVKIFEIGSVFPAGGEIIHIATADKKEVIEMTLEEWCAKNNIVIGDSYTEVIPEKSDSSEKFVPWSQYPFITRDIAVWVPESITAQELEDIYTNLGGELLVMPPRLFDTFAKDGEVSYAHRMVFQASDRTLTDDEISNIMKNITDTLVGKGWRVR